MSDKSSTTTYLVVLFSIVGSLSSLGNLIVNISGTGGFEASYPFLLIPLTAFALAFLVIVVEWDMKRDKWPGRLRELTLRVLPLAPLGPEFTPEEYRGFIVVLYKEYYRMALVEGRKELSKDFEKEIKRWEHGK